MKRYKGWLIVDAITAGIGLVFVLIYLGELIFSDALSPDWTKDILIWGIIFFCLALLIIIGITVAGLVQSKKEKATPQLSEEEILAKYRKKSSK
ncbi:MAG: hypothetical protein WCR33_00135 [Bacilli bacterium]